MQNKRDHQLIVLEGISGSGKTELGKLLAKQISGQYYATPPEMFRTSRMMVDEKATLEARYWFYLASVVQASHEINQILETRNVVCDKYILCTLCYHRVLGVDNPLPEWATYINPDHTFLIYCEDKVRLERLRTGREPVVDYERYTQRQQMERRCLIEYRKCIDREIDNTRQGPHHAVDLLLKEIRR